MELFLGIDTSCYTTSVALMKPDGTLVADARKLLAVKPGGRGLAQSEMVYQHTRNLPDVFDKAISAVKKDYSLAGIGISTKPRPVEGSYMPAFLVGVGYARVLAASHRVGLFPLSHQENHILAGIWSAGGPSAGRFIAVHLSGGTCEVTLTEKNDAGFFVGLLGGSKDISAGQFIDRIGVELGLPFPAGPEFERLAVAGRSAPAKIPAAVKNMWVSFAGPETHARRLLSTGYSAAAVAAGVEDCIAESLAAMVHQAIASEGIKEVLFVGGVTANAYIREYITSFLQEKDGADVFFPDKAYSSDNAVGCAYYALSQNHR